ncbi:MAG: hypothetical protein R6X34_22055 [Chloroflexota bacterium]|jgi:hypothetical protein
MSNWKDALLAGYSAYSVTVNSLAPDPNELNRLANTAADHQDIRNEQMMQQQRRGVEVASRQRASRTEQTG